jgi:hypothetical protein
MIGAKVVYGSISDANRAINASGHCIEKGY